ncbi:3-oxoacyl-[acyl-carrier-protein] reductase FabG [Marinovum algicola]|uniref:NADP-dependent 3-hydroxy acid dehydrogenase YdfG n=2 Tax=Roseobacteraceae TaxID=2854170 RepID=A0A975WBK1_9RHOB|nr:NADP-dependent 3-hydroxy acid dehydrogenase YdfG [Marinovum algicola]SLN59525.1 3-oxoacyl-[acyl-carrier-protein] reductase FabG [Marinovum algicola]
MAAPRAGPPFSGDARLTFAPNRTKPGRMTEKTALITGASRGLGAALAEALAPTHHIIAVARTTGALEELDDRIQARGHSATLAPMDITTEAAMAQLCRGIHDRWGKLDLWCHTAVHAAPLTPADHLDMKDWQKSIEVNVTALGRLIPFIAPLLGTEGQAVFFDDPRAGQKFFASYGATKAAQIALARSWQSETELMGPKVHVLEPAQMPSGTRARFFPGQDAGELARPRDEAARVLATLGLG